MKRPKVGGIFLATCVGSLFMIILYFQNITRPGTLELSLSDHRVLGHLPDNGPPHLIAQFDRAASSRKSVGGSEPPLRMEATVSNADQFGGKDLGPGKTGRSPLQTLYNGDQSDMSAVQTSLRGRREHLEEACLAHTRKRRVLTPEDLRHLIVDDKHGLLYCYVPKVACTNWKRVLMVLTGDGRYRDPLAIPANEAHVAGNLRTLSEYSTAEINRRLRSYLKFVFVREPFERLVSAYRNKFTRSYNTAFHKRYGTKIISRHRPDPQPAALERGDDVSFEEFVHYLVDPRTQREEPFNEHWERVHSLCHPCLIHYDVVGKYETLEQDSSSVLRLAGAEGEVRFPATGKGTRTNGDMAAQFFRNVSPFYQKKLYNLYRMDFLLFNYSNPEYLKFR